jgi:hypothetical protein
LGRLGAWQQFNSVIICVIGLQTAQFGFIPANVVCIAMSAINLQS